MCRSIVRFFLAAFIILFGTLFIFLLNVRFWLLESYYYKTFLKENGVYELALTTGKNYIENSGDQEGTLLIQPVLDTIVNDFATPDLVKTVLERNLDNIFGFLHGRNEKLLIYFPKDALLEKLNVQAIDALETEINDLIKSLPTCTPGQENQFEGEEIGPTSRIECLPAGFVAPTQDFSQLLADFQAYTGKNPLEGIFEEGGLLPGISEETDVAKLISQGPREPGSPDPEKSIKDVQTGFRYFNIGLLVSGILLLIFTVIYILLGDKSKILKSAGTILLLLGVPVVLVGAFLTFSGVLSNLLFDSVISKQLPPEILEQIGFLPGLISKFLSGAFLPIFITGLVLVVIGIALIIIQKLLIKDKPVEKLEEKPQKNVTEKGDTNSKKP